MKQKLLLLLFTVFGLANGFSQTVANQPPDIMQCGIEVFDLTQQTPIILGDQDPENFVVTYHLSQPDAESGTNVIMNPMQFVGQQEQQICARVSNTEDDSFAVTCFQVGWGDWQNIEADYPSPLAACDDDDDGIVIVDLTTKISEIIDFTSNLEVAFFLDGSAAEMNFNAIANPEAFSTADLAENTNFVFVRVTNPETGCYVIRELPIVIVECTNNVVSGTLTLDIDGNGCETGSIPAGYIMVALTNGNDVRYTITDEDGNYTFNNVPDGVNYIYVVGQGPFSYQASPESYTVTTPGVSEDNDFCIGEPDPLTDVAVFIYPHLQPRPGFPMSYTIVLQNFGNTIESGTATVTFDDTMVTFDGSSPAMTVSGNTLSIAYSNLSPYQPQFTYIDFTVLTPPTVDLGDLLTLSAVINLPAADVDAANNESSITQEVVNSLDPNDIACREGESITEAQADGYLNYIIRFQNIGNADAIFVTIDHTLDADLDPATFQPISSSHDYTMTLENSVLKLRFDDIHLAGAEVNEPESHGYFMFRVKPRSNVQLGDSFEAQASIVFDFNTPIVTNNYITTIESITGLEENTANAFVIYPNPASHIINLQVNDIAAGNANVVVADVLGKTVMSNTIQLNGNTATMDVSSLNSGMYFVTLEAEGKQVTKKLIVE